MRVEPTAARLTDPPPVLKTGELTGAQPPPYVKDTLSTVG